MDCGKFGKMEINYGLPLDSKFVSFIFSFFEIFKNFIFAGAGPFSVKFLFENVDNRVKFYEPMLLTEKFRN